MKNTMKSTKKEKQPEPKVLAVIPSGNMNRLSVAYADKFDVLFENGETGQGSIRYTPDVAMVERMNQNIEYTLEKMEEYKQELLNAKELLKKIEPIESYAKLHEEYVAKQESEKLQKSTKQNESQLNDSNIIQLQETLEQVVPAKKKTTQNKVK